MRDAIEIFEFADHGRAWTDWVVGAFRRVHAALRWAGAAFTTLDYRHAG